MNISERGRRVDIVRKGTSGSGTGTGTGIVALGIVRIQFLFAVGGVPCFMVRSRWSVRHLPHPTMIEADKYFEAVQRCTFQFQWIEASLKFVIATSQAIVKAKVAGVFKYRPNKERLDKLTLGKLIDTYERFGGDLELVKQLREYAKVRNNLAHEAFVLAPHEHDSPEWLTRRTDELNSLYAKLGATVRQLQSQFLKLAEIAKQEGAETARAGNSSVTPAP